jgi:hypothetical protein
MRGSVADDANPSRLPSEAPRRTEGGDLMLPRDQRAMRPAADPGRCTASPGQRICTVAALPASSVALRAIAPWFASM